MRSFFAAFALAFVLGLLACASAPPSPYFDDEKYLRFGVDPRAEADALVAEHAEQKRRLVLRLVGQHFTALGFGAQGETTAVRVITKRGIQLALDEASDPDVARAASTTATTTTTTQTRSYTLIAAPLGYDQDADGDGFEEVFVRVVSPSERCLRVFRVRDTGELDELDVTVHMLGVHACPSDVADEDRDGRAELFVELRLAGVADGSQTSTGPAPSLRVPLFAQEHRFTAHANPKALGVHLDRERVARKLELDEARARDDRPWAYRLALELAAADAVQGADLEEAQTSFDAALQGFSLSPSQLTQVLEARDHIKAWFVAGDSPAPASAGKNASP